MIQDLDIDLEKAQYLPSILVSRATGGQPDDNDYEMLRRHFASPSSQSSYRIG